MSDLASNSSLIALYRSLIISILLAVISVLAYFVLPERKERIVPDQAGSRHLFFDAHTNGKSIAKWINEKEFRFKCIVHSDGVAWPYCGVRVVFGESSNGKDFSKFQRLEIKLHYKGDNERLRMTMRNFNEAYSTGSLDSLKALDVQFLVEETNAPVIIRNHEWLPSEYWIRMNKLPRALTYAEFDNIIDFSVDLPPPVAVGEHFFYIEYVDLYGELLPAEIWYLAVSLMWLLTNLLLLIRHFFLQERRIRNDSTRLSSLSSNFDNLKQESKKYKELSTLDPLTGALNRNGFAEEMSQNWPDGRLGPNVALILIDIDYFKKINDRYGHDAGDLVLHKVASAIRTAVLGSDKLTRWGGEEFILFCNGTNEMQAASVAERVRQAIESLTIQIDGSIIPITISLGVGIAKPMENFDELFHRTDQALYKAKNLGRNRVAFAE